MTGLKKTNGDPFLTRPDGQTPLNSKPRAKSDIFSTLAKWIVFVIAAIPRFLAAIMEHFAETGGAGAIALGSLVFVAGVLFTTDSYWQSLFLGVPLFPPFEQKWAGWAWLPGFTLFPPTFWAGIVFDPSFIFAMALSFVIQIIQSATVRNAAFKTSDSIAGVSPKTIGLIAISSWIFDLIQTFSSRSPMQFSDPGIMLKCLMYNLFCIVSAEFGYIVYKMLKGQSQS